MARHCCVRRTRTVARQRRAAHRASANLYQCVTMALSRPATHAATTMSAHRDVVIHRQRWIRNHYSSVGRASATSSENASKSARRMLIALVKRLKSVPLARSTRDRCVVASAAARTT